MSYNKVKTPTEIRVILTKGGALSERVAFLTQLDQMRGDLKLYNVVTPERLYENVNIVRVTLDRSAQNGATLLTVEVGLREIRLTAAQQFTKTRDPSAAKAQDVGSRQPGATDVNPGEIK